ncbi:IclR family transcriptional regulator [Microlunatus soli]|uniref:Transcriptional regulator, IclR family n=1 Tax=Microlunatus soli TaxID=630515 RepID=A0A1H1Z0U7_9ACTN|nr:IclR family transcriptional regulator [Microlunatus soli]SDT27425.1 transcriptional regulator, IclR family [Microlunatus soli]
MSGDKVPSQSVARTLTVLETLVTTDEGLTLTALAKATGIPLATCSAIVHTLEQRGYASRRIVGRSHFWRATMGLYDLASRLLRKVDLASVAQSELRDLAHRVGMPVHIGVLNGSSVVYVAKAAPPGFIQFDTYPGKVAPFNLTALGKAISAYLDDEELRPLLQRLAVGSGPGALPGEDAFRKQLATVRRKGYAFEREEEMAEVSCVAVAFFDSDDHVAGAVGVTGFTRELRSAVIGEVADGLSAVADHISAQLGRPPS